MRIEIEILGARRERVGSDWRWDGVHGRFHRLYAVHAGRAEVVAAGRQLALQPGVVALVPAGQPADYRCERLLDHTWVHALVSCDGRRIASPAPLLLTGPHPLHQRLSAVPGLLARGHGLAAADTVAQVLLAAGQAQPAAPDRLQAAEGWALRRLDRPVQVAAWAAAMGVSAVELRRWFSQGHGIGPAAWLRQRRLDAAAALLRQGGLSVAAVAARSGFGGRCQLSRLMSRHRGQPPSRL